VTRHPVYSEEHEELRRSVRSFVEREIRPHVDRWEEAGHFPDDVFRRCGELGFLGLHYPERWGGGGGDLASGLLFVEELGRCGAGAIAMALSVQTHMATPALAEFGTDEQRHRWLRPAIAGTRIGAIAITEPDAGSDVAGIRTRADPVPSGWRLNGRKLYITNGMRAHWMTVVARTEPDNRHGVSLFCVDTSLPGIHRSSLRKLGMCSSDTAEVVFDDVTVPHEALIGLVPGQGFKQLMWQLQHERMAGAAACIGHARQVLQETIDFAHQRRAFGQPIAHFQVIAHGLADAATELEAATTLYDTVLWRLTQGAYPVAEISMVKKFAAQVQNRLADWCLQVHGGAGFMHEQPISRAFRDARLQRIGGGSDQVMNEVIAREMGITSRASST
jgi:alkylation response protein AidB-like acyl-CoA dehydrogenase